MRAERIHHFDSHEQMSLAAARKMHNIIEAKIRSEGSVNIALAGGTTPVRTYAFLGHTLAGMSPSPPAGSLHVFLSDERIVPTSHSDSNARMIKNSLIAPLSPNFAELHQIKSVGSNLQSIAEEYESQIKCRFDADWPRFDLIVLGIGKDGHTASIFPETLLRNPSEKWVWPVHAVPGISHDRITLSTSVLLKADCVLFLAGGRDKQSIIRKVMSGDPLYPASRVQPDDGELFFFIYDQ